jgi:hypothetical protein
MYKDFTFELRQGFGGAFNRDICTVTELGEFREFIHAKRFFAARGSRF